MADLMPLGIFYQSTGALGSYKLTGGAQQSKYILDRSKVYRTKVVIIGQKGKFKAFTCIRDDWRLVY